MSSVWPVNAMLISTSMPRVFQPLSSSHSLPLSGICSSWTQDSFSAEKKAHFVMSYLCSVQDSDEQATAYGFTGLTQPIARGALHPIPLLPETMHYLLSKQSGSHISCPFVKPESMFVIQKKEEPNILLLQEEVWGRLVCRLLILPSLFSFQTRNTKNCLFDQTAWTACYFCCTGN